MEDIRDQVDYLEDIIDKYKSGSERNLDIKNIVAEFQSLLSSVNKVSDEDINNPREKMDMQKLLESVKNLKNDVQHIQQNSDSGKANTVRERLRKKLADKKAKSGKMKGPDIENN